MIPRNTYFKRILIKLNRNRHDSHLGWHGGLLAFVLYNANALRNLLYQQVWHIVSSSIRNRRVDGVDSVSEGGGSRKDGCLDRRGHSRPGGTDPIRQCRDLTLRLLDLSAVNGSLIRIIRLLFFLISFPDLKLSPLKRQLCRAEVDDLPEAKWFDLRPVCV